MLCLSLNCFFGTVCFFVNIYLTKFLVLTFLSNELELEHNCTLSNKSFTVIAMAIMINDGCFEN